MGKKRSRRSGSEGDSLLGKEKKSSCPSLKTTLNNVAAVGMPATLGYAFYEFFIAQNPEKMVLISKVLEGAEAALLLKALYDFYSATSTAGRVAAVLAGLKCVMAMTALTYNLAGGEDVQIAPSLFTGVFALATLGSLIAACVSTNKVDRAAQGVGVVTSAVTAVGIFMGLLLDIQKKVCGVCVLAAQGASMLAGGLSAFFRPSTVPVAASINDEERRVQLVL